MNQTYLESILACPKCKTPVRNIRQKKKCSKCHFPFQKSDNIWQLLYINSKLTKSSQERYEIVHKNSFRGPNDGSYEILASIARGNISVDIACGQGQIERLAPETVAVEFSRNALIKTRKNGAKYLVLADAHALPFKDNSFDVAISAGNLEHLANPQKAINEMARISKIQVLTVHRHLPIPLGTQFFHLATRFFKVKHQPIESPIGEKILAKMLQKANLNIIFRGIWTLPVNYGQVIKLFPEFKNIPSCSFFISIKK